MERTDWILVVAALADAPLSPAQLQKGLFVVRELSDAGRAAGDFYTFEAYHYGPFCAQIYADAENLEASGLLSIDVSAVGGWKLYSITPIGRTRAEALLSGELESDRDYLHRLVRWVCSLSFAQLIRSIYAGWPRYKENSIFAG